MTTPIEAKDPLVGQRIDGRYLVRGVLGRGGMGVVYDGVHEQLGRAVAIKVLGSGTAGDQVSVERFLREARIASGLTHGNIVDVSDLGQLPDGRPYLVMAKMQGEDLCTLLFRDGPQPPSRVVELLRGVAAGLDLIHAKGYVHRDIKLENLMHVVREDGSEAVMVLDFGIVGLVATNAGRLTAEGSVFGTPAYLPPEVIQGDTMDRRGDVYALATCAFELMSGFVPFDAENAIKILPMKVMEDAPTMSALSGREFPFEIEAVIARNLSRNPADRHPGAGVFIDALDAAVRASAAQLESQAFADFPKRDSMRAALQRRLPSVSSVASAAPQPSALGNAALAYRESPRVAHSGVITAERAVTLEHKRARRGSSWLVFGAGVVAIALTAWGLSTARDEPASKARHASAPVEVPGPKPAVAEARRETDPPSSMPAAVVPASPTDPTVEQPAPSPAVRPAPGPSKRLSRARPDANPKAAGEPAPVPSSAPTQSAADLNRAAVQAMLRGRLHEAHELYTRATRVEPRNAAAFRGLGLINEKLGRKGEAIEAFRRALALVSEGREAESLRVRLQKLGASP